MYAWLHPIIEPLHSLLAFFFGLTHDWGVSVVCLTLSVRLVLIAVNAWSARQQVRQAAARPELEALKKRWGQEPAKLAGETMALYRRLGIRPLLMVAAGMAQLPVFMAMYGLFAAYGGGFASMMIPWLVSLGQADPLHLLPAAAAVLTLAVNVIPLTGFTQGPPLPQRGVFAVILTVVSLIFMWRAAAALCLYWSASALAGLAERGFYRTRAGKAFLGKSRLVQEAA